MNLGVCISNGSRPGIFVQLQDVDLISVYLYNDLDLEAFLASDIFKYKGGMTRTDIDHEAGNGG